jgi:hypothetical protein
LANASKIEPKPLPQLSTKFEIKAIETFVELLRIQHGDNIVLFVGRANTVPALIKALDHTAEIKIPETEHDNLFVVFPKSEGAPTVCDFGSTKLLIVTFTLTLSTITNKKGGYGKLNPSTRHY